MSKTQRPAYRGDALTHAMLQRRREEIHSRHKRALEQVDDLASTHETLGQQLSSDLGELKEHGSQLDALEQSANDSSLMGALLRPFTARRSALARRSVTEGLLRQYERVSVRLREATAFSDELKLCALELQDEVDQLHRDLEAAAHNEALAARTVLELEARLRQLDDQALTVEQRERLRDDLTFRMRTEAVSMSLFQTAAEQCRHHLQPARALRDTVLRLHEEMARYVVTATHTVNSAGRRIQGVGMMADAPLVVSELQSSLDELNQAMDATAAYVETSKLFMAQVLPELSAQLEAAAEIEAGEVHQSLEEVSQEVARAKAERALRDAADEEIRSLLGKS